MQTPTQPIGSPTHDAGAAYAAVQAERDRLAAEVEFLRDRVRAAEQAQAEMRQLMLAVTIPKLGDGEGAQVHDAGAQDTSTPSQSAPPRRRLWERIRGR